MRRRAVLTAALAAATGRPAAARAGDPASAPVSEAAPEWPTRPVRIVVPAGPGSSLDLVVRAMSARLAARWRVPVLVDNKPGAGGLLGMDAAAKASDGHTLAIGFNGPVAYAPFLYRKMPYDPVRDLRPVVQASGQPNVLAVHARKVPARTVADFVAWARTPAGRLTYASLGNGSSAHLTMELLLSEAGLTAQHVPFNGSPPAALALAQGEVDAAFMVAPALLAAVHGGRVRLLAVSSDSTARRGELAGLPSLAAAGYPAVESVAWNGFFVAAGTPDAVVNKLNADINRVLQDADVRLALDTQGLAAVGGSPEDFRRTIAAESRRWGPLIARLGVRLD